ncbi:MAG: cell wall hydrolase [Phenylobacterium sp.]|uniref:cell wall hydrolase n=1 Tax=Phenylobacterium sp. TaxID=1871053 RepID=UPI00273533DA|nr:cell wall hydrolase [Phenylobacterium sp.]MDP3175313.1 cell wall hydrolase [Phenylobacterium sp.]
MSGKLKTIFAMTARRLAFCALVASTLASSVACVSVRGAPNGHARGVAAVSGDLSDIGLGALIADMDPAMLALARRHDPGGRSADTWGRPVGWASLDLTTAPDLGISAPDAQTARELNALRPFATSPVRPMRPFMLQAGPLDAERALQCLTQAVYYEGAREPMKGQQAIAQVVLNRLRHPAYPKSVCGVVYQGSARTTGCQFSFTCDGSLKWAPEPGLWAQAQSVARRALAGFVMREVGPATHYHADYVAPYWAPTLVKLKREGLHIFYRWTGPWGEPPAFTGRYAGGEASLAQSVLEGLDARTQGLLNASRLRTVTLSVGGETRQYTVAEPSINGAPAVRPRGVIPGRRQPTAEEIATINASLATMERDMASEPTPAPTPAAP